MPAKSHCGLDLPLLSTFNFKAWRTPPADRDIPVDMTLRERNLYNHEVEVANSASKQLTRLYEDAVNDGETPEMTIDIGKRLRASYKYTEAELELMVTSPERCATTLAPIPNSVLDIIMAERAKRAAAKKEEGKSELAGSLVMAKAKKIDVLSRPPVSIPDVFLVALKHKLHPPLFWFTDARLQFATERCTELPMKKNTTLPNASEKSILDVTRLMKEWGSDENPGDISPLTCIREPTPSNFLLFLPKIAKNKNTQKMWMQAFKNFVKALEILCPAPTLAGPTACSYAEEMELHGRFFVALPDFELLFEVWYPEERELRNLILDNDIGFDKDVWTSRVGNLITAYKVNLKIANGTLGARTTKLSDLSTVSGSASKAPAPDRRDRQNDRSDRHDRFDRNDRNDRGDRDNGRNSFQGPARDSFRRNDDRERSPTVRALVCLICGQGHVVRDHPRNQTEFKDRKEFFATYERNTLKCARGEHKTICLAYNLYGRCGGVGHPAGVDPLHVCSLCGGEHPALSANDRCGRVRNGVYVY
ncbi:hypothetical protein C8F04DRAFT_1188935 [Mycena alexandri]|uniref:Uncharacterized protein n=1 Tax=Mycena alexandri TaxID=1745969 RepID=A0AAD6SHF9_9AGAR|nr:hypothetical protein C8F04DRAFT_1188935 [Mycena alexandri]